MKKKIIKVKIMVEKGKKIKKLKKKKNKIQ